MTRSDMVKLIQERMQDEYGVKLKRGDIKHILDIEEQEVYAVIALDDQYSYVWGTVMGVEKPPVRVSGVYVDDPTVQENKGWSTYKKGYPRIKWSMASMICDVFPPEEYFEQPEHRYSSQARLFRKTTGRDEIPEFEGLSDDKITEINNKADDIEFMKLSKSRQIHLKYIRNYRAKEKLIKHDYWKRTGYKPCGALDYDGPQRDTIDISFKINVLDRQDEFNSAELLERVRKVMDYAESANKLDKHPELKEAEEKLIKQVKEDGLDEFIHIKSNRRYLPPHKTKLFGEKDPWGNKGIRKAERTRLYQERLEKVKDQMVDIMNAPPEVKEKAFADLFHKKIVFNEQELYNLYKQKVKEEQYNKETSELIEKIKEANEKDARAAQAAKEAHEELVAEMAQLNSEKQNENQNTESTEVVETVDNGNSNNEGNGTELPKE